jgi:cytosolic 5'-nucleotidase 3
MQMKNVIISNPGHLERALKRMRSDGASKLHVLTDFDRTLTRAFDDEGNKFTSIFANLRREGYLDPEYMRTSIEHYEKYQPIELDYHRSLEERAKYMREWWDAAHSAMIKYGVTKQLLDRICTEHPLIFRDGVHDCFGKLFERNVPMVIMSAAPGDMIKRYINLFDRVYDNIHIIANWYEFDADGKMIGAKEPVIHSLNKYEITLNHLPIFEEIKKRPNVILMGDGVDDTGMVVGFDYENLIKIGFYNQKTDEHLELYEQHFDVVITGDGSMEYLNEILAIILE